MYDISKIHSFTSLMQISFIRNNGERFYFLQFPFAFLIMAFALNIN